MVTKLTSYSLNTHWILQQKTASPDLPASSASGSDLQPKFKGSFTQQDVWFQAGILS